MSDYPRYTTEANIDLSTGCRYRFVYGESDIFLPHSHDYYEIFLTVSGTVTHFANGKTMELSEGSLVFIRPDDVHGYVYNNPESTKTSYVNLAFTRGTARALFSYLADEFFSEHLLSCDMPPTVILQDAEKERLLAKLRELNSVTHGDTDALRLRVRLLLADIFVRLFYHTALEAGDAKPAWLARLCREMERPENFTAGTERLVALSGKSREHLSRSIKKHLGVTPSEYVGGLRINYAANLLINTNSPVIDVCFFVGFQNLSHFYRTFKSRYGVTPYAFRKKYGKLP